MNLIFLLKRYVRGMMLRRKFPTCVIYSGASVDRSSILGNYSVLFHDVTLVDVNVGSYSYIQSSSIVCNADIGKFCSIAGDVNIGLVNHPMHMVSTSPIFYDNSQALPKFLINKSILKEVLPRTTICADVWIGQGVMIKAGITIGVGAVIGAGSVVTRDVLPYSIMAGNPCKFIRSRFDEDIIRRLILSDWWNKSDGDLESMAELFIDPLKFLERLEVPKC